MDLKCELSPLVFAELYRSLGADNGRAEALEERLGQLGLDHQWLADAAELYEAKWVSLLSRATGPGDLVALTADHALLASWILAGLRQSGSSYEFGNELRQRVTERAFAELVPRPA